MKKFLLFGFFLLISSSVLGDVFYTNDPVSIRELARQRGYLVFEIPKGELSTAYLKHCEELTVENWNLPKESGRLAGIGLLVSAPGTIFPLCYREEPVPPQEAMVWCLSIGQILEDYNPKERKIICKSPIKKTNIKGSYVRL